MTVLDLASVGEHGKEYWCKCSCGTEKIVRGSTLTSGKIKGCGCSIGKANIGKIKDYKAKSRVGEKHNRLLITGILPVLKNNKSSGYKVICLCDCGKETNQVYADLKSNKVKSCGCYQKEFASLLGASVGKHNYKSKYNWYFLLNGQKIKCRSGYEVLYANFLKRTGAKFKYEDKWCVLENGLRYLPDFSLENKFVELKGKMSKKSEEKYKLFSKKNDLDILFWNDLVCLLELPYKSYSNYFKKAKILNVSIEHYFANEMYYS